MKNARAERAKLLFFPTKYANLTFSLPSPLSLRSTTATSTKTPQTANVYQVYFLNGTVSFQRVIKLEK